MFGSYGGNNNAGETLEIITFRLHDQELCVRRTTIREIRGWGPATPIPDAPAEVLGIMNLRGMAMGLVVDRVSDILTIASSLLQPVPEIGVSARADYSDGIIAQESGMICFLYVERMFEKERAPRFIAA